MALKRIALDGGEGLGTTTVIAIDRDKNSQWSVKWAVENLLKKKENSSCILIHVRSHGLYPRDAEEVPKEGRPPTEAELQQFFLPYRGFCARKGIRAKEVILHDIDVPSALVDYIVINSVGNIVVGASNRNALTRKFKAPDVPTTLLKDAPKSCAVYVISKGRVHSQRLSNRPETPRSSTASPRSNVVTPREYPQLAHLLSCPDTPGSEHVNRNTQATQSKRSKPAAWDDSTRSTESFGSGNSPCRSSASATTDSSWPLGLTSFDSACENLDSFSSSENNSRSHSSSHGLSAMEAEMRKLRLELKQTMELYNSACKESTAAREKATEIQKFRTKEEQKLEEAKLAEEAALGLAEVEKQKTKAATEAAMMAQRLAEMETKKRKNAEMKAMREAEERKRLTYALAYQNIRYRRYTIEEIEIATDYFNDSNKIGEGGYGPVYKAYLDHTAVAIKVLRPDLSQGQRQFQQEVEILSCIRHPHMVLLLGACPEYGCLVYEYMENGSLEDRLFRRNNTPPLPWRTRFRIASEIATALHFFQQNKPEPLVHRDLKPANILLDRNNVSKIGDVGLARLVPASAADSVTQYHMTAAAGTFCYIDPEYQQTGMLGVKSDIYSLGVMLLQIITAKPPMGLSHFVEKAIKRGTFAEVLDPMVTDWPVEEALSFAKLALQCCELRKRDRPDLGSVVLPEVNRVRDIGLKERTFEGPAVAYEERPYSSGPQLGSTESQVSQS